MNNKNLHLRRGKILAAFFMGIGFLLMLTEYHGGLWAGTFLGLAMFAAGAAGLYCGEKKIFPRRLCVREMKHTYKRREMRKCRE